MLEEVDKIIGWVFFLLFILLFDIKKFFIGVGYLILFNFIFVNMFSLFVGCLKFLFMGKLVMLGNVCFGLCLLGIIFFLLIYLEDLLLIVFICENFLFGIL